MYIRKTKTRTIADVTYYSYRLVETMRMANGKVRQITLLNLGSSYTAIDESEWALLTDRVKDLLHGAEHALLNVDDHIEAEARRLSALVIKKHGEALFNTTPTESHYEQVDISSVESSDIKSIGAESLVHKAAQDLHLPQILSTCGLSNSECQDALATILARTLYPASEVKTCEVLKTKSALDEVLQTDFSTLHKNRLYRISDVLLKSKDAIEEALYQREKTWFEFEEIVTLYDLTNTYFEGQSLDNELGALGRSKEKRSDCMLVTLALVLDGSGFIKKSQLFKGNVSEPKTLEEMVKPCSKEAIVVMDAGIATEDNIQWLTEHGYKYLVISRKRNLSLPEDISGVVVKEDQDNKVTTYLVKPSEGDEVELYCHSQGMENKGSVMYEKFKQRFIEELEKVKVGLSKKGCTKKYDKVCEKLGRLKEKYSKVASHFELELKADANKENALSLTWHDKETRANKNKGIYCIRTNQTHLNNQQIWQTYRMLNDIEAAFRVLKSDLGMRPVYHQTTERISGHIFISILAYHILHCIRFQLKKVDIHDSWETILLKLSTHYRVTTTMQTKEGKTLHIRKSTKPNHEQSKIYKACNAPAIPLKQIITTL